MFPPHTQVSMNDFFIYKWTFHVGITQCFFQILQSESITPLTEQLNIPPRGNPVLKEARRGSKGFLRFSLIEF